MVSWSVCVHSANACRYFRPLFSLSIGGVGAKCLVSDIQPSSFKVKLASASVAVVVRQSEAPARYPNYVAAVEHCLCHSAHITRAPIRFPGHNLTTSTKGDANKQGLHERGYLVFQQRDLSTSFLLRRTLLSCGFL